MKSSFLRVMGLGIWMALSSAHALNIGETVPNFVLPHLNDPAKTFELTSLRGKVVYIDFWASWCTPCKKSLPMVDQLYQKLKSKDFEVVAVNLDDDVKLGRAFVEEMGLSYIVLSDTRMKTPQQFHVIGMPTSFLIDQSGTLISIHQGFKEGDFEKISQDIRLAVNEAAETSNQKVDESIVTPGIKADLQASDSQTHL